MAKETRKETAAEKMERMVAEKKHSQMIDTLSRQGVNIKYVVEYKDEKGKITSKLLWDLRKTMNGPILVETFDNDDLPQPKD